MLQVAPHELLELHAFVTRFPSGLGALPTTPALSRWLGLEAAASAPLRGDETVRAAIRRLLRDGGFKPSGRSKPASEYLLRAAAEAPMRSINVAVDACNAASLHSGLPISVIDLDRATAPLRVEIAPAGTSYVFNASGQCIDVSGLLCLFDASGPCANAVKDAQRTKTDAGTVRTLSLIWSSRELPGHAAAASRWYRELLREAGAVAQEVSWS